MFLVVFDNSALFPSSTIESWVALEPVPYFLHLQALSSKTHCTYYGVSAFRH